MLLFLRHQNAKQLLQRIIKFVGHSFFERNDSVVRNCNMFRTNFGAAFRDIAIADPVTTLQIAKSILGVERVHIQCRRVNEESGADEVIVLVMVAQNVAHVLAKKTLDTFAKLLNPLDILLHHRPSTIGVIRWPWIKWLDLLLDAVIPRNIGNQVAHRRECAHGFHRDGRIQIQIA